MLPDGWRKMTLDKVALIQTGIAKGKKDIKNPVKLPYLRVANVQDGCINLEEVKEIDVDSNQVDRYSLKKGDVLLTEGGDLDKLGRGDVWQGQINPCLHQNHVFAVRANEKILLPYFLAAQAGSHYGKTYFLSCAKQTTNLASINSTQLKNFPILLPPLPEQQKIAQILSTWDKAIDKLEALIRAKQQRKKALMQQLLTGKVRFARFEGKWLRGKLIDFFQLQRGFDLPLSQRQDGNYKVIASNGQVGCHDQSKVKGPGVITGRSGTIGKVIYVESDYWPLNTTLYVKDFKGNSPLFVYYFLEAFELERFGNGTGVPTLNRNDVHPSIINFPNLQEQQKIASVLSTADTEIETHQKQLKALKQQKKGLMQQLLTGKARVKLDTEPLAATEA